MSATVEVPLYRLAHARSGDKGNRLNISLICRDRAFYSTLAESVTSDRVVAHFAARRPGNVTRYELPKLFAFNYVLDDVLEGGVNSSLGLDGHGKSLSFFLLTLMVKVDPALLAQCAGRTPKLNVQLDPASPMGSWRKAIPREPSGSSCLSRLVVPPMRSHACSVKS